MASVYDIFISGDHDEAKGFVAGSLEDQGFTLTRTPAGGLIAKRGSMGMTIAFGAMAGKKFQITFTLDFFVDAAGNLVARLTRDITTGALKGGALGANMTNNRFIDTANALVTDLTARGVFVSSTSH